MGAVNLTGYLAGAIVGIGANSLGHFGLCVIIAFVLVGSAYITSIQIEPSINYTAASSHSIHIIKFFTKDMWIPLRDRDFRLVFISRFFFQISIATIQQFLQYWIADCASAGLPSEQAVSLALLPLLVLSPIGAFFIPQKRRENCRLYK